MISISELQKLNDEIAQRAHILKKNGCKIDGIMADVRANNFAFVLDQDKIPQIQERLKAIA